MVANGTDLEDAEHAVFVAHLDRIAERVGAMTRLVSSLRDENRRLQGSIERTDAENRQLRERVDAARDRVERLLERLPDA